VAKSVEIKIPDDIEYRVISNAFGLLIACAGLLGGQMVRMRSFDCWTDDIVPLLLLCWLGFRLYRNFLSTMIAYREPPSPAHSPSRSATAVQGESAIAGHLTGSNQYSAENVIAQVSKRIESQKAETAKRNKFTN
jgi:hypothetical protein